MAASQRDVKQRIESVKNIRKITRAMEMVAAARLRRAEQRIAALRPYAGSIRRGVSSLGFRGREVSGSYVGFTDRPAYADARGIAQDLVTAYVDDKIDRVEIFYNGYVSPLVQEVRRETLLPLQEATILEGAEEEESDEDRDD